MHWPPPFSTAASLTWLATCSRGKATASPARPLCPPSCAGPQLNYTDSLGKTVNLSLTGGGVIEVFRAASGDVQSVSLVGTVARKSVLSLRANKAGGTSTYLPPIQGSAGVRFRYRTPANVFRSSPVLPNSLTHKAKPVRVKHVR